MVHNDRFLSNKNCFNTESAMHFGTDICESSLVCNETYLGNLADLPWNENAWVLDHHDCFKPVQNILTILLTYNTNTVKILRSLQKQYPDLTVLIGVNMKDNNVKAEILTQTYKNVKLVSLSKEFSPWVALLDYVNTPFVVVGHRLTELPIGWGNFERSIRLINGKNYYSQIQKPYLA